MVVEIAPPLAPDGTYALGADGVYGPAEPALAADLRRPGVLGGYGPAPCRRAHLSCDCPNGIAIWLDAEGSVRHPRERLREHRGRPDLAQVYRLVGYPKDHPGVRALQ